MAQALDLKGAFNAVLPGVLLHQLSELEAPRRIINFVNFLTTRRMLHFSHGDTSPRLCGVGVLQGGVLSPILFSIHLRRVNEIHPAEVRAAMYADDLLLYFRHSDPQQAQPIWSVLWALWPHGCAAWDFRSPFLSARCAFSPGHAVISRELCWRLMVFVFGVVIRSST